MNKDKKQIQKGILRIPRPRGLTLLSQSLNKNKETKDNQALQLILKKQILKQWVAQGMQLNGIVYSIDEMGIYLGLPTEYITNQCFEAMRQVGNLWIGEKGEENARAIFSQSLIKGLEIQALSHHQVQILMASQGGEYRPFISATVNQALANLNSTQAGIHSLLKMLTEKQSTNIILNQYNTSNTQEVHITSEEALAMINGNKPSMLADPLLADEQILKYQKAGLLPDINARTQDASEWSKPKHFTNPLLTTGTPSPSESPTKSSHHDRRERSENVIDIVEDEDEFKA